MTAIDAQGPGVSSAATRSYKLGGVAFIVAGILFLTRDVLAHLAGPPPSNGVEILAWVESSRVALSLANEVLFFAAMTLVPAVIALWRSLAGASRAGAATGCGIIAAVVPLLAVLLVVEGRLIYPIYGLRVDTPAVAELVVTVFYGGLHAAGLMMAAATFLLSLALRRGPLGPWIAYLGFVTSVLDIVGAYPDLVGPELTLVCRFFFAAWFVALGAALHRMPRA